MQKLKIKFGKSVTPSQKKLGIALGGVSALVVLVGAGYYFFMASQKPVEPIDLSPPMAVGAGSATANAPQGPAIPAAPMQASSGPVVAANAATSAGPVPGPVGSVGPVAVAGAQGAPTQPMNADSAAQVPLSPMAAGIQAAMTPSVPALTASAAMAKVPTVPGQPDAGTFNAIGQLVRVEVERSAVIAKLESLKLRAELAKANGEPPAEAKPAPKEKVKKVNLVVPAEPVNTDVVELLSIVGRPGVERAEVSINGIVVTTAKQARLGTYYVNNIDANCVYMTDRLDKTVNRCILR